VSVSVRHSLIATCFAALVIVPNAIADDNDALLQQLLGRAQVSGMTSPGAAVQTGVVSGGASQTVGKQTGSGMQPGTVTSMAAAGAMPTVTSMPAPTNVAKSGTICRTISAKRSCTTYVRGVVTKRCTTVSGRRTCLFYAKGHHTQTCVLRSGTKTCTYYRRGHATRRCVQHSHDTRRCHTLALLRTAAVQGASSALLGRASLGLTQAVSQQSGVLNWQGWPNPNMPTVGRIAADIGDNAHVELCTGTVVTRTLVLTAGHCVWSADAGDYFPQLLFTPGQSWNGVPGDGTQVVAPYGVWKAVKGHYWTTSGYTQGDASLDWGLIEFGPNAAGQYIGDVVGTWPIQTGITWNSGAHVYAVGYPAKGFWSTDGGFNARAQYACDATYDGEYSVINSGYELWIRCTMSPGASGGPWFVQIGNPASWVIGGVTNRCYGPNIGTADYCSPNSDWDRSSYFDGRFLDFWNAIQPYLTQ
jgi:hypothetical protein